MAEGDIGEVKDTLTFDAVLGSYPRIIHVDGSVFAIAYIGPDGDGWLKTITISDAGAISVDGMDSMEFDAISGGGPSIVHVDGSVFAIAYTGEDADGFVCTVTINADGSIDDTVIDTLEFDAVDCDKPWLLHLAGDAFIVFAKGANLSGRAYTFNITSLGAISDPITDDFLFGAFGDAETRAIRVNSTFCAVVYKDIGNDLWLKTVPVSNAGVFGEEVLDSLEFEPVTGFEPTITHISGTVYAIAYSGAGSDGYLMTVSLSSTGIISVVGMDTFEFDTVNAFTPWILHISGDTYAIVYTGPDNEGWLKTLTISPTGQIAEPIIDSLEIDGTDCQFQSMVHVTRNIYAIAYTGTTSVGKVLTVDIETIPPVGPRHLLIMGIG